MMMEMFLDEQKARKYNINIDECYLEVDQFFEKRGVKKVEKVYIKELKTLFLQWLKHSGNYLKHHGF